MAVNVPLFTSLLNKKMSVKDLTEVYQEFYGDSHFISVGNEESGFISANVLNGTNSMELLINGNDEQLLLTARFDNLGKGASGAAVQNMNIALGLDETVGLL